MIFLKENMQFLRKKQGITQNGLATLLETKRSLIGSYEEGRGVPKLEMIKRMADIFGVSLDDLLSTDISKEAEKPLKMGEGLKVLTVIVTPENDERITIVPVKAAAGYLNGRSDPDYIGQLPHFSMPVTEISQNRSYRVFQIKGDSMLPVPPGSYLFCEYLETLTDIREGNTYVLITSDEGVVYKRVYLNNEHELLLKSDNPEYAPYTVESSGILEIWQASGYLTFDLPDLGAMNVQKLTSAMLKLEEEVQRLKEGF
jgi:transcriptional regulator with XRE-family HTH domain